MDNRIITEELVRRYVLHMGTQERAAATIAKYAKSLRAFTAWMGIQPVTKERVLLWKEQLISSGKAPVTVNGALAALHGFFSFMEWEGLRVKFLKVQRAMFRDTQRELTREEYLNLVTTAHKQGRARLALLLETIGGTGVRVSEVKYITVEAAKCGRANIAMKGKIRTVLIPGKLAGKLLKYAQKQKIASGEIFVTASGRTMSRRQIWGEMKSLCRAAGIEREKVFPHNLRHLFARRYYAQTKDIVQLADVLGHSAISTTRIYLITTGEEHARQLEKLGLVS